MNAIFNASKSDFGLEQSLKLYCDNDRTTLPDREYFSRYSALKRIIEPYQKSVEKAVIVREVERWREENKERIQALNSELDAEKREALERSLFADDPLTYLNDHGPGHVMQVIRRATELLRALTGGHLTYYELFLLLCAIQAHDAGNYFGRREHEKKLKSILNECKNQLVDSPERNCVLRIAMAHGGKIGESKDTIGVPLRKKCIILEKTVREQFLAALLRFADELADDISRADRLGIEQDSIPAESQIYHFYSYALHTVSIIEDPETELKYVSLSYEFQSDVALRQFKKAGSDRYLLDEIYDRTLKMEKERRYCIRFLRPALNIEGIKVDIFVQSSEDPFSSKRIGYTLSENGYPTEPAIDFLKSIGETIPSGSELATQFC